MWACDRKLSLVHYVKDLKSSCSGCTCVHAILMWIVYRAHVALSTFIHGIVGVSCIAHGGRRQDPTW